MLVKTYMPLKGTVMMVWTSLILMNTFQCSAQSMHHRLSAQNLKEASAVVQGGVSEEAMLELMRTVVNSSQQAG